MTRNSELDLCDIVDCTHEPELPISEEGQIIGYACRCGRYTPLQDTKEKDIVVAGDIDGNNH